MARDSRNIRARHVADDLTVMVYSIAEMFPREEIYCLPSLCRRSAISLPTNVPDGANGVSKKDHLHFLSIVCGSLAETEYFLHLAKRVDSLTVAEYQKVDDLRRRAAATLIGLIRSVRSE